MGNKYLSPFSNEAVRLGKLAKSAQEVLEDDDSAPNDPTSCDHRVGLPYKGGFACGACHKEFPADESYTFQEIWINMEFGLIKVPIRMSSRLFNE